MTYLLGIDAGQTVTKAACFDLTGRMIAVAHARTAVDSPRPRWQERDMTLMWRQTATAIADCLARADIRGDQVAAVGLCGHNDGVYPVDAAARPSRRAILATDSRAAGIAAGYQRDGVAARALPLTGQSPFAGSPAAVYAWLRDHEPATLDNSRWLLFSKDWLRLCLTGEVATDRTDASASFTDVNTQGYSSTALELYGLDECRAKLPTILDPAEVAGHVTAEAAARTGLAPGTPVVAGAHDVDAAALGMGAVQPGAISVIMGTFAINQIVSQDVRLDHRWQARSFLRTGNWLHMSTSPSSASNLDWAVRRFGPHRRDGAPDFEAALSEAASADATDVPLFLPFLYGSPHGEALGAQFVRLRGWHDRDAMLRAVCEGVVFNHRTHLEALGSRFDVNWNARLSGGGAASTWWTQLLADVTGLAIEVTDTVEASARGAAVLAGLGVGAYDSLEQAAAATVAVTREQSPRPDAAVVERYADYVRAVAAARRLSAETQPS